MVLSIMVPHFPALGSRGMPPVPPTIFMSGWGSAVGTFTWCVVVWMKEYRGMAGLSQAT